MTCPIQTFDDIEINNRYHLTNTGSCNFAKSMDQQTSVAFNKGHGPGQTCHYSTYQSRQ